ncbi:hypothetical protein [Sphingomonas natans]|nr:hypothetical protein [Sphingomonas sp. BIUV-7]
MKNVTVSLDEESFRRGRVKAAEMGKTLSAVVREFLTEFGTSETEQEQSRRKLRELFEEFDREGIGISAGDRLSRDELYDRARARQEIEDADRG